MSRPSLDRSSLAPLHAFLLRVFTIPAAFAIALLLTPVALAACPGEGSCCEANGTPGCDDQLCCEAVCAQDPFCCDVEWDSICVDLSWATSACGESWDDCVPPPSCAKSTGTGNCCVPNGSSHCENSSCCFLICGIDPFCCNTEWDELCAEAANEHCAVCEEMCLGDINGDGLVDGIDMLLLLQNWGACSICHQCPADIAGNCTVDTADLLTLLNNWGPCNP